MNSGCLWSRTRLDINKKQKHFSLPYHQIPKNSILHFGFYERIKREKKRICNYICRSYRYSCFYFHINVFQSAHCYTLFFHRSFETENNKENNLQNPLIKFSPTASTTDRKYFLKCYGYFLKFSGFYLAKHFDQFGILLTWLFNEFSGEQIKQFK